MPPMGVLRKGLDPMPDNQECPICGKFMFHLRQHLTACHKIPNVEEKSLLLKWSSGRVRGKLNCRVCDKVGLSRLDKHLADLHQLPPNEVAKQMLLSKQQLVVVKLGELRATRPTCSMVSRLDLSRSTPKHSPLAPPLPSPGPVSNGFLASSPSTPAIHPVYCCMSCTALKKRVEGLESSVGRLQAMVSMQHHNSPGTAQATSSATLASPSPGNTHSLDREIPSKPRSPASPASLKGYLEDEHLNTGPTVTPSTQPEPAMVSMQHHNSPGTAQATSSATLASPSPGNTHSLDREFPFTPRSPASPASLKGYLEDEHLNTGPTVTPSTQPEPAMVSMQHHNSPGTAQATSSATLASPSPGNTHSLDREIPSTPRSPASPASLKWYLEDEHLNTGPTVTPSTQPEPTPDNQECPICGKFMFHLRQHLTACHKIPNVEEKSLLLKWSSGRVRGKLNCRVCDKVGLSRLDKHLADLHQLPPNEVAKQMLLSKQQLVVVKLGELRATRPTCSMVSRLDLSRSTPKHSPLAPPLPSPGPVSNGFLASSPSTPAIHPVYCCMSCTALKKRVEGLESSVGRLQAMVSMQHHNSPGTAQATSSATLASPSPGNTHSLDREIPSKPRSPASPASLKGYLEDEHLNTGPTVTPSTQPEPAMVSMQHHNSPGTAQATSSATLASPSPGNTHSLDREIPFTPRSPASPASLKGYLEDEHLNTGPTVTPSTQPEPAMVSMQHHNSPGTAQATSSATLASPSPGNTHSLDREIPSTPRSPASPASLKWYLEDEHLNTGPTVTPSTQPEPTVPFSMLFLLQDTEDLSYEQFMSPMSTDAFNAYIKDPMWSSQ
ncbi:hypothetical protein N1851_011265 [Merluccius polli]|uniref:C2H2-type domain-containing protein n=1 Tax=Merluccius polli TaxID=89951 RepID=A0AA47MY96_MERPO|nr:hypothetical protein N1851_011265 [Merluccius polli]